MFEVIAQSQKDDYQSLEILKIAYQKLGKTAEALGVSRRLAAAYHSAGSYSLALQECESVLAVEPNAEILAMLGEIENRLQPSDQSTVDPGPEHSLIAKPEQRASSAPATASGLLEPGGRNTGQIRKPI